MGAKTGTSYYKWGENLVKSDASGSAYLLPDGKWEYDGDLDLKLKGFPSDTEGEPVSMEEAKKLYKKRTGKDWE